MPEHGRCTPSLFVLPPACQMQCKVLAAGQRNATWISTTDFHHQGLTRNLLAMSRPATNHALRAQGSHESCIYTLPMRRLSRLTHTKTLMPSKPYRDLACRSAHLKQLGQQPGFHLHLQQPLGRTLMRSPTLFVDHMSFSSEVSLGPLP